MFRSATTYLAPQCRPPWEPWLVAPAYEMDRRAYEHTISLGFSAPVGVG